MPLATETVNIDITLPDGNEFASATFVARINAASWDTTDNQAVPQVDVVTTLDSSGTGSIDLWPNDRGENGTYYTAVVRAVLTGEHVEREYRIGPFQPTDGDGPFNLNALLSLGFSNISSITPTLVQQAEDAALQAQATLVLTINEQTDDYTLALADASNAVAMNKATANTLTIPTNATVAFQIGTQILVYQSGVGATSISAPGVTLRPSAAPAFVAQWASAMLIKIGADEWLIQGGVT